MPVPYRAFTAEQRHVFESLTQRVGRCGLTPRST